MTTENYGIRIEVDSTSVPRATQSLSALEQATRRVENSNSALAQATQRTTSSTSAMTQAMSSSVQSSTRWVNEINNSTRAANSFNNELAQTAQRANTASNSMNQLKSVLGAFGVQLGAVGLAMLAKDILKTNMEMEALRARLEMTLPSLAAAQNAFQLILKIAKETPQSIDEITKAFLLLRNSGLDTSEKSLRGWTDAASRFGGTADMLTGVIRQFGQATMKGALHAQDANAMIERGIPLYGLLTQATGKSAGEVIKMMEAGELNNKIMQKSLDLLFEMSSGSSVKAMDTMKGKIEALGSAWSAFQDALMGDKSEGAMKKTIDFITAYIEWQTKSITTTVDQQIAAIQEKLANPSKSFISKGLSSLGVFESESELKAQLKSLQDLKQKGIADTEFMQKDALAKKQAEEAQTQIAISKDADKYMKQQLGLIKENQKAYFQAAQEKYGISEKALKSLAALESGFNNQANAKDRSKAQGIFQFFPAAAKDMGTSIDAILKDEGLAIDKGAGYFAKMLEQSGGRFDEALARWHDGMGRVNAIIKKRGAFDVQLVSPEGQQLIERFNAGMKAQGVTITELERPYKQAIQNSERLSNEQQRLAESVARNDKQLTESTAVGKYNATISELKGHLERAVKANKDVETAQYTYSQGIENANETLLKNTDYVVANTKALEEQARARKKYLEDITDYNATIDELTRNKQRGAITPSEYGLGVAQANAGLMNKVTDKSIPVNQTSEVIDAKNIDESAKALKELTKYQDDAIAKFNEISNSGSMAFDGLLGGVSAVASAFNSLSDELSGLYKMQSEESKKYKAFMDDATKSEADKAKETIKHKEYESALNDKVLKSEISGMRQIAGASSKMFAEKSAGRKVMHTLEMTFSAIEMAMSIKQTAANAIEAITNQGSGDPYTAFGRIAAMAAIMAALGVGVAGSMGGNKTSSTGAFVNMNPTKSTGTVLGDANANSSSIKNITDVLNDIHAKEYPELKGINDSMKEFGKTIVNFITGIAKATNSFTDMTFGSKQLDVGTKESALSKIPIIGGLLGSKTTVEKIGEGMIIATFNPLIEGLKLGLKSYSTFKTTKESLFGTKTKIEEFYSDVPEALNSVLDKLFSYMGKTVVNALDALDITKYLGISMSNFAIGTQKWDWLKTDNKQEYFNNMINATADRVASVSQHIIGVFQKLGEGLYETLGRLAIQQGVVINKYRKLGIEFDGLVTTLDDGTTVGSLGMAALSDSLINMYNSSADATDGLKNFTAAMDALYNVSTTKGEKSQAAVKGIGDYFKDENLDKTKMFDPVYLRDLIKAKTDEISKAQAVAAKAYEDVAKMGDVVGNAFSAKGTFDLNNLLAAAKPEWQKLLGVTNLDAGSWDKQSPQLQAVLTANKDLPNWKELYDSLHQVSTMASQASSALNGAYKSQAEYDAALKVKQDALDKENAKIVELTNTTNVFTEQLDKTIPKVLGLQNNYLDLVQSESQKSTRKHADIIRDEYQGLTEDLSEQKIFEPVIKAMGLLGKGVKVTAADIQTFVWATEDAAKAFEKLNDASKYIKDFGKTIKDWVENLRATQLGTPQSQLQAAQKSFESRAQMIKNPFASIEEKRTALSGITGYADTYINAIKNFYASSEEGQKLIADVVKSVSDMPEQLDVAQMQLNVLEQIKGNTDNFKDFPPLVAAELSKVKLQYEFVDVQKALPTDATGRLSDSTLVALNETLDKIGTGLLNTKFQTPEVSGVTLQTASSSLAFIEKLATTSMPDVNKILSLESLSNGLTAAGTAIANYDYAPTETKLATLKTISTDFSKIITDSSAQMSDANFTAVFSSAMSSVSNAVTALPTNLTAMASAIDIAKNSVGIWVTALTNGLSSDGAAFAVVTSLNTSGITLDASLDDTTKAQILEDIAFSVQQTSSKLAGFIDGSSYTAGDVSSSTAEILDSTTWAVSRVLTPIDEKQFGSKDVSDTISEALTTGNDLQSKILTPFNDKQFNAKDVKDTISSILTTGLAQQTKITEQIDKWEVVDADVKSSVDELIKTGALGLFTTASGILSKSDIINAETLVDSISQLVDGSKGFYTTAKGIVSSQDLSTKTKELGVDLLTESTSGFFGRTKLLVDDPALTTDKLKSGIGSLVGSIDGLIGSVNNEVLKIQAKIDAEASSEKARIDANTSAKSNDSSGISDSPATQPDISNSLTGLVASNDKLYGKSDLETIFTTGVSATQKKTFVEKYGKYGNQPMFSSYFTDKSALSSETEKVLKSYDRYGGTLRYAKLIDGKIHAEFINPTNTALKQKSSYSVDINDMPAFAKGGIANQPSIFGEAGAEAAVPLPDGRSIPVTLSRDSANDNGETVAELKEISRKQEIMINTLIAAAQENRKQNAVLVTEIEGLRTDTRLRRAA